LPPQEPTIRLALEHRRPARRGGTAGPPGTS